MNILELQWWAYVSFFIGFFIVCLGLNYAVKKMNEAKMRERLIRVQEKASATQCTRVGPVITVSSEGEPRANIVRAPQLYSPPVISLVFDKEENRRIGDVYNLVKPLTDWTYGDPSISTNKSLETINVLNTSSDAVSESTPIKMIECELVTAKATSSHKFTEKVPMNDKIDSYDLTDRITPKNYSFSEIPGIADFPFSQKNSNNNSVTDTEPGHIINGGTTLIEPKNTVAKNNPFTNIAARMVPTNSCIVENTVKITKVIRDKKSREKNDIGCLDSFMSKKANLKNIDDIPRIEKSVKSSSLHSGSIWNVTKITPIEKKPSSCTAATESSHTHSNRVEENIWVKTSKSDQIETNQIVAKETSFDAQNESQVREYVPIRNNVIMNSSSNERSDNIVIESVPIDNIECKSVPAKPSYIDEIDSYDLPDLVTLENHGDEQFPGIMPFSGKNLYTKIITEHESVFKKTDTSATKEITAKKESGRTIGERSTSYDSAAEYISLKNIVPDRMFPTNIFNKEITVKNPKVLREKKSNEEIDTNCLDGLMSKIVIFKNMNDETRIEKRATGINRNFTKISSVDKKESSCIAAKVISCHTQCDRKGKNISVKTNEYIVLKKTSPDTQIKHHVSEYASIRNSVKNECRRIEFKKTSPNERSSSNVTEYVPIKTSEPGRIIARQTAWLSRSDTNVTVFSHALENAAGYIWPEATTSHTYYPLPIRKSEFGFLAAEETSDIQSDDNVSDTYIVQFDIATPPNTKSEIIVRKDGSMKKTESGSINVKETSNRQIADNVPGTNTSIAQLDLATPPNTQSEIIVSKDGSMKNTESGSINVKETYNRESVDNVPDTNIVQLNTTTLPNTQSEITVSKDSFIKKTESGSINIKVTFKRQSEINEPDTGSGSIVARETASLTLSGPDVLNPIKMSVAGSIAVREVSNRQSEDNVLDTNIVQMDIAYTQSEIIVSKDGSMKNTESGSINIKETSCRQSDDNVPDTNIVQLDTATLPNTHSEITVSKDRFFKKTESGSNNVKVTFNRQSELDEPDTWSGSIVARETASLTLSGPDVLNPIKMSVSGSIAVSEVSNIQSEDNVLDTNIVQMDRSGRTAIADKTMRLLVLEKDNEDIKSGNLINTVTADTSETTNDQQKKHPPVNHDEYD